MGKEWLWRLVFQRIRAGGAGGKGVIFPNLGRFRFSTWHSAQ